MSVKELTHLSLFSGIGGLDLAAEWAGIRTVGQCEWADFPRAVLEKHWPGLPRWKDIRDLTGEDFRGKTKIEYPTVVSGGFPCQPHSLAGKRLASDDERDLWDELFRVYCETGARWLVGENVGGLLTSENGRFFGRVLRDLAQRGCHVWWYCFPAHAAGAPFWGERIAIVAAAPCIGWKSVDVHKERKPALDHCGCLAEAQARSQLVRLHVERSERNTSCGSQRNDDGIPGALDRLKAYGNAVVPQQFYPIFRAIAEVEGMLHE